MDLLLDTHTFLWYSMDDSALSPVARVSIADTANQPHLSVAPLWEIAIKVQLGKLRLHIPFDELVTQIYSQQRLRVVPISPVHLCRLLSLPLLHRDPFDRLMVAQALAEGMTVVGCDVAMDGYGIRRLW